MQEWSSLVQLTCFIKSKWYIKMSKAFSLYAFRKEDVGALLLKWRIILLSRNVVDNHSYCSKKIDPSKDGC